MAEVQGIAPIIPVTDVRAAVAFFCDTLGFERRNDDGRGGWALIVRGEAGIQFIAAGPDYDPDNPACQTSAYVWVEGLDALWEEVRDALSDLPPERVRPPFDQEYGMREFHVSWEAFLVFFGEEIAR
jgi:catechol 2,3-dioxygenase-like lactoylglutathione lyase family enzyme